MAIKALSGDLEVGPSGPLSPWSVIIITAAVFSFYASARSLQIGDGVAVIAVTWVAANLSTILAGLAVFGDRLGTDPVVIGARLAAFALILVGAALIPAPVRAGEALQESAVESETPTPVTPSRTSRTSEARASFASISAIRGRVQGCGVNTHMPATGRGAWRARVPEARSWGGRALCPKTPTARWSVGSSTRYSTPGTSMPPRSPCPRLRASRPDDLGVWVRDRGLQAADRLLPRRFPGTGDHFRRAVRGRATGSWTAGQDAAPTRAS